MPAKRKATVTRRAGAAKRTRPAAKKTSNKPKDVVVWGRSVPNKTAVTHKYTQLVTMSCNPASTAKQYFKCNGMYDPDTTGTGHQPFLFDQIGALYDHYTVVSSRIKIQVCNAYASTGTTGAMNNAALIGLFKDDDASTTLSVIGSDENTAGFANLKLLSPFTTPSLVLTDTWKLKDTFGPKDGLGLSRFQGTTSSDPTELTQWYICFNNYNAANVQYVDVLVQIEYDAIWTEQYDIAQS